MAPVAFIPNDPLASGAPPLRTVSPHADPSGSVRFDVRPAATPGTYAPHTPDFDYWQSREALLQGLRAWRHVTGGYPTKWQGDRTTLPVISDAGDDLNAFYDRASLQFFHHTFGGKTVHSSESVDVVCHEEGHALLDALRPDFFDVPFIEVGALHEAFGDCLAIVAGLNDTAVRTALIRISPDLSGNHFLESLAEELGDAIRREYGAGSVESGALRHALNSFRWTDPTTLPPNAPANQLAGEVHSFSRVFTGAFWDTLRGIHAAGPHTVAGLDRATRTAGKLLISSLTTVPATTRIFEGVARRMASADATLNGGVNVAIIQAAFEAHGIHVPAPVNSLPVSLAGARTRGAAGRQLRDQFQVPSDTRLQYTEVDTEQHGEMTHVSGYRPVELPELQGVRILVPGTARLRTRGRSVVGLVGDIAPADQAAIEEARAFALSLVANGDLMTGQRTTDPPPRRMRGRSPQASVPPPPRPANAPFPPTHAVRLVAGEPTIVRVGFS